MLSTLYLPKASSDLQVAEVRLLALGSAASIRMAVSYQLEHTIKQATKA